MNTQGQGSEPQPVYQVDSAHIHIVKTNPLGLVITVTGQTGQPNWSGFAYNPVEYIEYPRDGIHDINLTGIPPGFGPQVVAHFEFSDTWIGFPEGQLKGVRIHSGTNSVEAMLP